MPKPSPPPPPSKEPPPTRRLRVFAFDPSITTEMANYDVSEVVVRLPWERARTAADGRTPAPDLRADHQDIESSDRAERRYSFRSLLLTI